MKTETACAKSEAEVLAGLRATISPSRLSLFLQCRLKFWFRYVRRLQKPTTPALHLGKSVHAALKAWSKARWRRQVLEGEQLKAEYLRCWGESTESGEAGTWEGEEEKFRSMGWSLVETYLQETPIPQNSAPDAVEVPVEADLSPHGLPRLIGVLDLVQCGVIVDFKTAATTPSPDRVAHNNEIQTTAYALLYRATNDVSERGFEIHTLVKLKTPKLIVAVLPPMSNGQQTRFFRLIESYLAGLDRGDWMPSPGLHCAACEYFKECRSWP